MTTEQVADEGRSLAGIADAAQKLNQPDFTIRETTFHINKLPALDAAYLFKDILTGLGDRADEEIGTIFGGASNLQSAASALKLLMLFDRRALEHVANKLFERVTFSNPQDAVTPQPLVGPAQEMCFRHLEPVHFYEVLGRALIVNFTESFAEIASRLPQQEQSSS